MDNKSTFTVADCFCALDDIPQIVRPGKNNYGAETYIGNWYEETVRNTLKREDFLRKRECGDLSIQRTQTMVDILLKPIELSTEAGDGCLHYGDKVQIVSPGPSCKTAIEAYPFKREYCKLSHLALSASVPPEAIDLAPYLNTDSIISASPLLFPVVRNSFIIEYPECPSSHEGSVVNYGEVFRIRAFDTQHFPMYLFSNPAIRLHAGATHSAKPKVRFSDLITAETLWCCHPLDPDDRLRMELGVPVKLRNRLLLRHNASGQNLSTETNFPVLTYFGSDWEVTVDTKLEKIGRKGFKAPVFENIWYIDTKRGQKRDKDPCDEAFEKQAEYSAKINVNSTVRSAAQMEKEEEENCRDQDNYADDEEDSNFIDCATKNQEQIPRIQDILTETEKAMTQMSLKGRDGYRMYDPRSGPQPNAYSYRVQDNEHPFYPNQKWNCGKTDCCNEPIAMNKAPRTTGDQKCEKCECVETPPPGESPNAPIPFKRLIM